MEALSFLTNIAVILLVGVIISAVAHKLRIPDVLLLIMAGVGFGVIATANSFTFFPATFLSAISILALAMIVFDATSKIKIRDFDKFSGRAVRLAIVFFILNVLLLSLAMHYVAGLSLALSILFATVMGGTSPDIVLTLLGSARSKVVEVLKIESVINTPLTVIFPFLVVDLMVENTESLTETLSSHFIPFLTQFISGIGAGIFVGIILFKVLRKTFSSVYSPLAVFIAALATYVLAENLNGNGVLAVTALGLFFGNINVKEKYALLEFESVLAKSLYILVFVLIGSIIQIPFTKEFFISSGILFGIYLLIRFMSVLLVSQKDEYGFKEKLFITLVSAKGIAVAVVTFALSISGIVGIKPVLDFILIFMVCSILVSSIASWCSCWLLGEVPKPKGVHHGKRT